MSKSILTSFVWTLLGSRDVGLRDCKFSKNVNDRNKKFAKILSNKNILKVH